MKIFRSVYIAGPLALLALLAVFKAPARPFWFAAIIATEWGHYLAVFCVLMAVLSCISNPPSPATWIALFAAFLFLTPLARAINVAQKLPADLVQVFGNSSPRSEPGALPRARPLDFLDLFRGIPKSPDVRVIEQTYVVRDGKPLAMDIYQPARWTEPMPVVVVIHGGSWQSGDRKELPSLNQYLAARGYLVVAVDYRLAPQTLFPAPVEDVLAAITYLKQHAEELGLDPRRFALVGRSAGAQVALAAAYSEKEPAIKGVIAISAPIDLIWGYSIPANPLMMNSQKVLETYLGGTPDSARKVYAAASPLFAVNRQTPPTLMIHGQRDEIVSPLHNERLIEHLNTFHRPYFYLRLPWATHGLDANFSGPSGQLSTYAIEHFLADIFSPASR